MNILIIGKKINQNIIQDRKNNNVYFLENIKNIKNYILEKNIEIVLFVENKLIYKLLKLFLKVPIIFFNDIDNKNEIEKVLQNKIAYFRKVDIPVLMYHRVIKNEEEIGIHDTYVNINNFEEQIRYLKENSYISLTFEDLVNGEYKKRFDKNKNYIIITFDDGYKDNLYNVLPILKKYNMKAVLFLVTNETYNKWDIEVADNTKKEKKFDLMTKEEVKKLIKSGLIEIGGHTTSHLDMPSVDLITLKEDLKISNIKIEELTGKKPISFAYPWGRNTVENRRIVKESGYKFAVSTESGSACFSDDLYEIARVGIYSNDSIEKFKKKISGNYLFMREKRNNLKKFRNNLRKILGYKIK